MSAMEKVNNILGKLPFVKLAGSIPEGIRGKIPFLNVLIPFANHIASGVAIVVLVACFGGGGGVASSKDFSYQLITDEYQDYYGVTISEGIEITGYSGNGGKVVIPATIEGYPVKMIEDEAFIGISVGTKSSTNLPAYRITELVIPEGVVGIGWAAFAHCRNITAVTLPLSLKFIENGAFAGCTNLEDLIIPASASFQCQDSVFIDSEKLPLKTRQRLVAFGHANF